MPAPGYCSVCNHPESFEINEELIVEGASVRDIAGRYGLEKSTVQRHKVHIPGLLVKAREDWQGYEADAILERIERLERETLEQLEAAKTGDEVDRRIVLQAIREQRGNIELVAKVKQLIDQAPKTEVVLISPRVQQVIVQALAPYPEARKAVADSLAALEEAS